MQQSAGKHLLERSSDAKEQALLRAIARGSRDAMAALYRNYYPRLFRFLHRLSHDYSLTEELVNDVMLVVWQSADKFQGASKVSTWILGIAYRQGLKKLSKRRLPLAQDSGRIETPVDERQTVERRDLIVKALSRLTPNHRLMIEFVLYLGLSYREVADVVGCPVNTAKTRVHHARKQLREILTTLGYRNEAGQ